MATPQKTGRIDVIDAIRGFAIFGILIANIQSWSGYKYLPFNELANLPGYELDSLFYWLHIAFVDGKFYAIFSLLFGVGFGLQWARKGHEPECFLPMYRRRLAFLLLFGVLHALLWSGDILALYALLAFVMVALRDLSPSAQLRLGLLLLCAFVVTNLAWMLLAEPTAPVEKIARQTYADMRWDTIINAFSGDSWLEVFSVNLHNVYWRWAAFLPNGRISRVLGFFLIGCYLARSGFFEGPASKARMVFIFGIPGMALTWVAMELGLSMNSWAHNPTELVAKILNVAGQLLMGLSYMCLLALLFSTGIGRTLMHPLTLIGRTAFTSYLGQTVIGITIFYGVGFGQIATLGLAQLWGVALGIYTGQVIASSIWLRYCTQGPVEWLWRGLSLGRFSPLLRSP